MRLIFVRHGEPDYEHDCLTETGKLQAAAAAERLSGEGISAIFSSPNGRARETAAAAAARLGLPVTVLDYMHEISWGGPGIPENGHPWTLSDRMLTDDNFDFFARDWRTHPSFAGNDALKYYDLVVSRFGELMKSRGYTQDGRRFFCDTDRDETVAVFSHGGSGAAALSGLLSLPFPYVLCVMPYDYTSVIILDFPVRKGEYVHPRLELFNDARHIRTGGSRPAIQQVSE